MAGESNATREQALERTQGLREAWDNLNQAFTDVVLHVAIERDSQRAGARAVQAVDECTRRLREVAAESPKRRADDDDDY
jgi:hypothetical protein